LSLTSTQAPKADPLPRRVRESLTLPPEQGTPEQQAAIFSYWRTTVPEWKAVNDEIDKLWAQHPEGETVLNLAQRRPEDTRQTHLLERGNWQKPGKPISPGVPAFLHPMPAGAPMNRLGLARWLVDRKAPTTARVAVNRVWQAIFGIGLVETADDFGTRASAPTHPELLDYLAREFVDKHGTRSALDVNPTWRLLVSPSKGTFVRGAGGEGASLEPDSTIGVVRSTRDETAVFAPHGGTIVEWLVEDGDLVSPGQPLVRLHPEGVSA